LTRDFPPPNLPDRPALDVASIKTVLVEAVTMADGLKPMLEREDVSADFKSVVNMLGVMVNLVSHIVEKGVEPLSAVVTGVSGGPSGRGYAAAARRLLNPLGTAPKPPTPGKKELLDALEKSEKEAVLFGANLGSVPLANRGTLNINLTTDLQKRVLDKNNGKSEAVTQEALRVVEDALSCVDSMDFIGPRSKPTTGDGGAEYCTMPIKLNFTDRDSRVNFERTIRENTNLRASQSLPQSIRKEMAVFRRAMEARYPEDIVMTRPDIRTLEFISFRKKDGEKKWNQCVETHPIPLGIMLPGFRESSEVALPDLPSVDEDMADGGGD
jgi:hypothetical protein